MVDVDLVTGTLVGDNGSYGQQDVSTNAVEVVSGDTSRRSALIQNLGPEPVFVGFDSSVTPTTGVQIAAGGGTYSDETFSGALYAITSSGTSDVRFQEVTL